MPDSDDYTPYAAPILFPRTPADLTTTTSCPACFTPITAPTCTRCALDLTHPLASRLAKESTDAAAALSRRLALIGRIRFESRVVPAVAPAVTRPEAVPALASPPPPSVSAPASAEPHEPRRSSVQVALLVVGISLLSVAAIFFLVYAFINFGIIWRSVIIAAITVTAFVVASLLRRKKLTATAEGIAVFGVVLVYLDAFAVRANALFGADNADPLIYWGATLLISAAAFYGWHRLSALRVASVAAFTAVVPGSFLLVVGLADPLGDLTRVFLGLSASATVGLLSRLTAKRTESSIVTSLAALAWSISLFAGFAIEPGAQWAPTLALSALAVVAAAHAFVARASGWQRGWAAAGGVAAAASVGAGIVRSSDTPALVLVPVLTAAAVALALDVAARRTTRRGPLLAAAIGAGSVAAIAVLPAAALALRFAGTSFAHLPWTLTPLEAVTVPDATAAASVAALGSIVVLVAGASALAGVRRTGILTWSTAATLLLAAPLLGSLAGVLATWLLLAALGVVALFLIRRHRLAVAIASGIAATAGYSVSWASEWTWLVASAVVVALLLVARRLTSAKPALLGFAIGVTFIAAAALPAQLWSFDARDSLHAVAAVGVILLAIPLRGTDRRVSFWLSLPTVAISAVTARVASISSAPPLDATPSIDLASAPALAISIGLVVALGVLIARGRAFVLERGVASAALGLAVLWVLDSASQLFVAPPWALAIVPITAGLIVSATGLLGPDRRWRDLGAAIIALPALQIAVAQGGSFAWLVLLFGAVTALLFAVSRDGLVGSASWRRHIGWAAIALASLSLWWNLRESRVETVELYVLPVAILLLGVAIWVARRTRQAVWIVLGALVLAIVPISIVAATGPLTRAIVIAAVSLAMLVSASFIRSRYADAAAAAGAAGILTVTIGRVAFDSTADATASDLWLTAALLGLAAAAIGQSRLRSDAHDSARSLIAQSLVVVALVLVTVGELPGMSSPSLGSARAVTVILLLSAVHVIAVLAARSPVTRAVGYWAISLAAVAGVAGYTLGAIDSVELASVPIAVALLVGASRDIRSSWFTIAPGLLVLLLPSLVATIGDRPVWRLVGIGVFAITAIVYGAVRRQQAPFLIGIVIVLVHAAATFAPQIRLAYLSLPWWLWAGFGGLLITALAARYEHRIRNLKQAVGRISEMR